MEGKKETQRGWVNMVYFLYVCMDISIVTKMVMLGMVLSKHYHITALETRECVNCKGRAM